MAPLSFRRGNTSASSLNLRGDMDGKPGADISNPRANWNHHGNPSTSSSGFASIPRSASVMGTTYADRETSTASRLNPARLLRRKASTRSAREPADASSGQATGGGAVGGLAGLSTSPPTQYHLSEPNRQGDSSSVGERSLGSVSQKPSPYPGHSATAHLPAYPSHPNGNNLGAGFTATMSSTVKLMGAREELNTGPLPATVVINGPSSDPPIPQRDQPQHPFFSASAPGTPIQTIPGAPVPLPVSPPRRAPTRPTNNVRPMQHSSNLSNGSTGSAVSVPSTATSILSQPVTPHGGSRPPSSDASLLGTLLSSREGFGGQTPKMRSETAAWLARKPSGRRRPGQGPLGQPLTTATILPASAVASSHDRGRHASSASAPGTPAVPSSAQLPSTPDAPRRARARTASGSTSAVAAVTVNDFQHVKQGSAASSVSGDSDSAPTSESSRLDSIEDEESLVPLGEREHLGSMSSHGRTSVSSLSQPRGSVSSLMPSGRSGSVSSEGATSVADMATPTTGGLGILGPAARISSNPRLTMQPTPRADSIDGRTGYEVVVTCVPSATGDEEEVRWVVVLRRPSQNMGSNGNLSGAGANQPPTGPISLSAGSQVTQAPPLASSLNLSLALDMEQPTGKLAFIALPAEAQTPSRTRSRGSFSSPRGPSNPAATPQPPSSTVGPPSRQLSAPVSSLGQLSQIGALGTAAHLPVSSHPFLSTSQRTEPSEPSPPLSSSIDSGHGVLGSSPPASSSIEPPLSPRSAAYKRQGGFFTNGTHSTLNNHPRRPSSPSEDPFTPRPPANRLASADSSYEDLSLSPTLSPSSSRLLIQAANTTSPVLASQSRASPQKHMPINPYRIHAYPNGSGSHAPTHSHTHSRTESAASGTSVHSHASALSNLTAASHTALAGTRRGSAEDQQQCRPLDKYGLRSLTVDEEYAIRSVGRQAVWSGKYDDLVE